MHSKAELTQSFFLGAASSVALMLVWKQLHSIKVKNENSKTESLEKFEASSTGFSQRILPDELREEQLSRNILFFGEDGMTRICQSSVAVVGLGGVGSHAANMLARAGVGCLRLIDFDQVTLSSLNRHACATLSDVGKPKVEVMKNYITNICAGHCKVDGRIAMFKEETQDELLGFPNDPFKRHDFIVDAIDDVSTKVQLLAYCVRTGTRVISCMGAGGKCDVTRLHIGDLPSACHDPLATKIRLFLKRKQIDVTSELINVVYSSEKTVAPLAELSEEQKQHGNEKFGALDHMRVRVIPVLGTTPATMGNSCAAFALCEIGKKPFLVRISFKKMFYYLWLARDLPRLVLNTQPFFSHIFQPLSGERMGRGIRHKIFQHLKNREKAIRIRIEKEHGIVRDHGSVNDDNDEEDLSGQMLGNSWVGPVQVDCDDVEYLVAEVWRNRCAATGKRLGVVLELVRWDLSLPSVCQNLVLLCTKSIHALENNGSESFDAAIREKIEHRLLASCKADAFS